MLSITNNQKNVNLTTIRCHFSSGKMATIKKTMIGMDVEKMEPLQTLSEK
jgi:hypothetical protein